MNLIEMVDTFKISKERVGHSQHLGMRKLCKMTMCYTSATAKFLRRFVSKV